MTKHTKISAILNITVIGLVVMAWVQAVGSQISMLDVASLLGVMALSLMWVHYAADAIAPRQDDTKDPQYIASRIAVLVAILLHPFLVNAYLFNNGFGLPPESYEKLVGSVLPVLLGWVALAAFISFELRGKLKRFERHIFHANIVAMFLILIHGFLIGMVMMTGWFAWVWWVLLVSFVVITLRRYNDYYQHDTSRRLIAMSIVLLLALVAALAGLNILSP